MLFGQYPKVNVFTGTANLVEKLTTPTRRKRQFYCQIRVLQGNCKFCKQILFRSNSSNRHYMCPVRKPEEQKERGKRSWCGF